MPTAAYGGGSYQNIISIIHNTSSWRHSRFAQTSADALSSLLRCARAAAAAAAARVRARAAAGQGISTRRETAEKSRQLHMKQCYHTKPRLWDSTVHYHQCKHYSCTGLAIIFSIFFIQSFHLISHKRPTVTTLIDLWYLRWRTVT